jgi:hypothetical protein
VLHCGQNTLCTVLGRPDWFDHRTFSFHSKTRKLKWLGVPKGSTHLVHTVHSQCHHVSICPPSTFSSWQSPQFHVRLRKAGNLGSSHTGPTAGQVPACHFLWTRPLSSLTEVVKPMYLHFHPEVAAKKPPKSSRCGVVVPCRRENSVHKSHTLQTLCYYCDDD